MAKTAPLSMDDLTFVDADALRETCEDIPSAPGVYLWFVRGGDRILELTHYYDTDVRRPAFHLGRAHLYTGAANDLRFRLSQHLRNECPANSSPRKSLLAIERIFGAVSAAVPSSFMIEKDGELTEWIYENVVFGYLPHPSPFSHEARVVQAWRSPFNIAHQRQHRYSKYLMAWRAVAFPSDWMTDVPFGRFESSGEFTAHDMRRSTLGGAASVNVK